MMNEKVLAALNDQMQMEFTAFYTYLSMAAWLEANDWQGFAAWMQGHSDEEQVHAMKIYNFINDRKGKASLQAIAQPAGEFASVQEIFETALAHEKKVTASINKIYQLAKSEGDYPTEVLMQWFINEQVEEEKIVEDALVMVKRAGSDAFQLLFVEKNLDALMANAGGGGEAAA